MLVVLFLKRLELDDMQRLRLSLVVVVLFCPWRSSSLLGWVESPGYPRGYPPHASFNWSRCAPEGHVLSFQLMHLDLEDSESCEQDAVQVFSGGHLISVLCGKYSFEKLQSSVNSQLRSSPGGCLSLSFHSDYSNRYRHAGFRGFYTTKDLDECEDPENSCTHFCHNIIGGYYCSCRHGYHLGTDNHTCTVSCTKDLSGQTSGRVSSPLYPAVYPENSRCEFSLSVEPQLQLQLLFSPLFDVEQGPDGHCLDNIRVDTHSGILGPFCGSSPPSSPLLTHSHQVKIHFESDGFGSNRGFSVSFQTKEKVCLAADFTHSKLEPQKEEYSRGEVVTARCDTGHFVNIQQKDGKQRVAKEYRTTCQSTGEWTPRFTCRPVNCGRPNIPRDDILVLAGPQRPNTLYQSQVQFNCSSPYYTLEGDDTYTCGSSGEWISSDNETELPKCTPVCGMPQRSPVNVAKILGGKIAALGEMPWHLLTKQPKRGGASLINDRWAVTAAHLVEQFEEFPQQWFAGTVFGPSKNPVTLQSGKIIIHPGYVKGIPLEARTNYDNDIALIRFTSRVVFSPNVSPICLPESSRGLRENDYGTIAGFGVMERNFTAMRLRHASISVYPETKCRDKPGENMLYTDNMFCAGAEGKDSCEKDSGGPFFLPALGGTLRPYRLMGIVSWGAPCFQTEYKGYYIKVQNYVQWIHDTIEATENSLKQQ